MPVASNRARGSGLYPNHSRGQSRCCFAASITHYWPALSITSFGTRLNQPTACFVSPTRRQSSPTR